MIFTADRRSIPGPRGLPVLGMMPEMVSDMLGLFTNTAREYGGIAQFKLLNKSYLLVTNPDYVKYILQDNYKNYPWQKRGNWPRIIGEWAPTY
jgi:hypothetical protein